MRDAVVHTLAGDVRGRWTDEVASFLGIPYAAAPFGPHRFRAPAAVTPWTGVRDALEFGPTPPGAGLIPGGDPFPDPKIPGEDCLNLNVWTPALTGKRPVLVWIPGGGNVMGSAAQSVYGGAAFARDGVVLVSINHRLGAEGFAHLPDAPANRGLRDQIAALEWVRDNISAFGGDPANVTVAGLSAGAGSVMSLLSLDTGLFRRAIIQSGLLRGAHAPEDAALVTARIAQHAGVEATAQALSAIEPETLAGIALAVYGELQADPDPAVWGTTTTGSALAFSTVVDGSLVTVDPWQRVLDGSGQETDLMVGCASDELLRMLPGAADVATTLTQALFRGPINELAEHRPGRTFVYEFAWRSPLPGVGAAHGLDIGFVFDTLGHSALEGDAPPQDLADTMHQAWISFARDGAPGWSEYPSVMRFDTPAEIVAR
ncbi:carboxylesterase family protein [Kutzneria sp. NPDC051319]|uniref:carboxylesterase/lipase family protein n=1 Tax=Kutzneria sp. NPDC051319 TaxID=3155047 RepID=UPI003428F8CE